jgi:hypothetical protein
MTAAPDILKFLSGQLSNVETTWSMGTVGAIAEFARDSGETAVLHRDSDAVAIATGRGGMCIAAAAVLRLIASESLRARRLRREARRRQAR